MYIKAKVVSHSGYFLKLNKFSVSVSAINLFLWECNYLSICLFYIELYRKWNQSKFVGLAQRFLVWWFCLANWRVCELTSFSGDFVTTIWGGAYFKAGLYSCLLGVATELCMWLHFSLLVDLVTIQRIFLYCLAVFLRSVHTFFYLFTSMTFSSTFRLIFFKSN